MTDVVERLRKVECVERELAHDCDMPPEGTANWEYAETCKEAAAEIEKLRAALQAVMNDLEIIVESGGLDEGFLNDIVYTNARAALEDRNV